MLHGYDPQYASHLALARITLFPAMGLGGLALIVFHRRLAPGYRRRIQRRMIFSRPQARESVSLRGVGLAILFMGLWLLLSAISAEVGLAHTSWGGTIGWICFAGMFVCLVGFGYFVNARNGGIERDPRHPVDTLDEWSKDDDW